MDRDYVQPFVPPELRQWVPVANALNPVNAIGDSMVASQRAFDPSLSGYDRGQAAGNMLAGVLGVVGPGYVLNKAGAPMGNALAEALTGMSAPATNALGDFARADDGGIRLWHGSPHDFDAFDMSKIGTGEGAQAYGHGLYFAESADVANNYRAALKLKGYDGAHESDVLMRAGWTEEDLRQLGPFLDTNADADGAVSAFRDWTGRNVTTEMRDAAKGVFNARPKGRLYEVDVNADPADFLDWDKPFSSQPEGAKNVAREWLKAQGYLGPKDNGPRQLEAALKAYRMEHGSMSDTPLQAALFGRGGMAGGTPENVTATLREAGIPGIRYLDAGSRGAGKGSRNYVVFDDKLITILKKYGLAGLAAMGGGAMLQPGQAQAGPMPPPPPMTRADGTMGWK